MMPPANSSKSSTITQAYSQKMRRRSQTSTSCKVLPTTSWWRPPKPPCSVPCSQWPFTSRSRCVLMGVLYLLSGTLLHIFMQLSHSSSANSRAPSISPPNHTSQSTTSKMTRTIWRSEKDWTDTQCARGAWEIEGTSQQRLYSKIIEKIHKSI